MCILTTGWVSFLAFGVLVGGGHALGLALWHISGGHGRRPIVRYRRDAIGTEVEWHELEAPWQLNKSDQSLAPSGVGRLVMRALTVQPIVDAESSMGKMSRSRSTGHGTAWASRGFDGR